MDPDAALAELRQIMQGNFIEARTRELFEGLDKWLSSGGFMPSAWVRHRRVTL